MRGGAFEINSAYAGEKIRLLLLETVFLARLPDTRHRHFQRHVQQQRQIRTKPALHPIFQHFNILQGKQRLNFTNKQCVVTVGKYGNTSSASIPMAMNDAYEAGRLKKGDLLLLDAFGGGFTWGSALLKFGGETANNF